jgi:hypothetical protein
MAGKGHFDQFPPAAPSVGCPLDQRTFAEAIRQLPRRDENGTSGRSRPRRWLKLSSRQADDRLLRLQFAIAIARVICDRVAAKIIAGVWASASAPDANGLYPAQDLTSREGKWR